MNALLVAPAATQTTTPKPLRWTSREFWQLGNMGLFEGRRAMLIDGVIYERPPMNPPHAAGIALCDSLLVSAFGPGCYCRVQLPFDAWRQTGPMPDLLMATGGPRDHLTAHPVASAVLLVVEVSDTTLRFDLGDKASLYATANMVDYWVLDLDDRRLHVHRDPRNGQYLSVTRYAAADRVAAINAPHNPILVGDLLP